MSQRCQRTTRVVEELHGRTTTSGRVFLHHLILPATPPPPPFNWRYKLPLKHTHTRALNPFSQLQIPTGSRSKSPRKGDLSITCGNNTRSWYTFSFSTRFNDLFKICMCNPAERAVWENLADFSIAVPSSERKEGSVIRGSEARFFPNGKSNLWLGNKLDFLRQIEITQQSCISQHRMGSYIISFVIRVERIAVGEL